MSGRRSGNNGLSWWVKLIICAIGSGIIHETIFILTDEQIRIKTIFLFLVFYIGWMIIDIMVAYYRNENN